MGHVDEEKRMILKEGKNNEGSVPDEAGRQIECKSECPAFREDNIDELFSRLSEEERNILLKNVLKAYNKLKERRLNETKILGLPEIDGEEEDGLTRYILYPERKHTASYAQMHFRLAESQFFRLEDDNMNYRVTKVEYIVNPVLEERFREAQEKLRSTRGEEFCHPVFGFHGTSEESILSIVKTGFRMPGNPGYKQANDSGWYGRGIYLSEYPSYAREYMERGGVSSKLLLCQVLVGKVFHCKERIDGEALKEGFDSHLSPEMHQLIIFNTHHILPSYIVHFEKSDGDFRYKNEIPNSAL